MGERCHEYVVVEYGDERRCRRPATHKGYCWQHRFVPQSELRAQGAAAERARIVAWLRSRTAGGHGGWYAYIADRIETDMPEQGVLHAPGNGDRTDNAQPEQGEEIGILQDDLDELRAERDALAAELAAMRGERAPDLAGLLDAVDAWMAWASGQAGGEVADAEQRLADAVEAWQAERAGADEPAP